MSSFSFSFLSRSSTWDCSCVFVEFSCRSCFSRLVFLSFRSSKSLFMISTSNSSPADSKTVSVCTWKEYSIDDEDSRLRICSWARRSWSWSSLPFSSLTLLEMSSSAILRFKATFSSSSRLALSLLLSLLVSIRVIFSLDERYTFSSSWIFCKADSWSFSHLLKLFLILSISLSWISSLLFKSVMILSRFSISLFKKLILLWNSATCLSAFILSSRRALTSFFNSSIFSNSVFFSFVKSLICASKVAIFSALTWVSSSALSFSPVSLTMRASNSFILLCNSRISFCLRTSSTWSLSFSCCASSKRDFAASSWFSKKSLPAFKFRISLSFSAASFSASSSCILISTMACSRSIICFLAFSSFSRASSSCFLKESFSLVSLSYATSIVTNSLFAVSRSLFIACFSLLLRSNAVCRSLTFLFKALILARRSTLSCWALR